MKVNADMTTYNELLATLIDVESDLPELLDEDTGWNSLLVNYEDPHVWRMWRSYGDCRVLLHKLFPCGSRASPREALYHPHPWPSLMRVFVPIGCGYVMDMGFGPQDLEKSPPVAVTFNLSDRSLYVMTDPEAWHAVMPIHGPVYTLMVVGKPWGLPKQERFGQKRDHSSLDDTQRRDVLEFFRAKYPCSPADAC